MKHSTKEKITNKEYYQLLGLQTLALRYYKMIAEIEKIAQEITGEIDLNGNTELYGYTSEWLVNAFGNAEGDVNNLLDKLKLQVETDALQNK